MSSTQINIRMTKTLSSHLGKLTARMGTNNDSDTVRTLIQMKYEQLVELEKIEQHEKL